MSIYDPNDEQKAILESIAEGKSVICDAVAGAGKTTTILWLTIQNKDKRILQITYNKQLKEEVRKKAKDLKNLEVHTYHSLTVKYYDRMAYED